MQRKYCLRPLTPNNELVLECTPNSNEAVATSNQEKATTWFYSDNNLSSDRDRLFQLAHIKHENTRKLHTELAVFAGSLYKLILGPPYPEHFVGKIDQFEDFSFQDPFVRVCKKVESGHLWKECFSIDNQNISFFGKNYSLDSVENVPIKGLTAALVAGVFLAEIDWNYENLLITDNGTVVKIDPGLCINNLFLDETKEDILSKLTNLLQHYVFKIEDESYFFHFKKRGLESFLDNSNEDSESELTELIHEKVSLLFNNQKELFQTLVKIINLSDALVEQAKKDFSPEFSDFTKRLVNLFLTRINNFKQAAYLLDGFKDYIALNTEPNINPHIIPALAPHPTHAPVHAHAPQKYAHLLNRHLLFYNPAPQIYEDSNPNFVYLEDNPFAK